MSDRYLIINADDFGMCNASFQAVSALLTNPDSALTSATIMTPCAWAPKACRFAAAHPELAIGTHLTLTCEWGDYRWKPVTDGERKSLCDEEGFMWHTSRQVEENTDINEVEAEIRAQIEFCKRFGMQPSHVDNHMGSLYGIETGRFELLLKTLDIAGEYGFPYRFPSIFTDEQFGNSTLEIKIDRESIEAMLGQVLGYAKMKGVAMPDYLIPNEWDGKNFSGYSDFQDYIYALYESFPEGVTETYMHPALESDELKNITGCWERRVWENRILSDPKTKQHIESLGIKLINYRDLKEMRK